MTQEAAHPSPPVSPPVSPRQVVAVLPNWLGDVAMCTPALRALRRRFAAARLTVAGRGSACALLDHTSWIDRFLPLEARPGFGAMRAAARELQAGPRDLAVVFPHSFRAALLARVIGAGRRAGQARNGRGWLLTDRVPPHRENGRITPVYMGEEYLALVKALGCLDDGMGLELHTGPEVLARVRARIPAGGPLVGFAPGAAFGPSKRWLPERFAAVADALRERAGARCVLLTGPGEEDTRAAVQQAARAPLLEVDGGAPSIDTLKATVSQLDLLVCNDSGPRHVGVAFRVPTVCIMGPTSPRYSCGPYERGEVLRVDVDCGPCQKPKCRTDHRCMTGIPADWVVRAALDHLPQA